MFETSTISEITDPIFLDDVTTGLSQKQKSISSKYFYDEKGDRLFQDIMALDEYYLTRAEYEIFESKKEQILSTVSPNGEAFNLVEFGAGDGYKTKVLLEYFSQQGADFKYLPIDISQNALDGLELDLNTNMPELEISGLQGDYFDVLEELSHASDRKNVVLFLGSNIGNFNHEQAIEFLSQVRSDLNRGDLLIVGIDLKKDSKQILAAYDDAKGVTAAFNLNLLDRINKELNANFDTTKFQHQATYDPVSGECKSYLISLEDQKIEIADQTFTFQQWEPIHTEISRKYHLTEIHDLAKKSGFKVRNDIMDSQNYFVDTIWEVI